MHTLLLSDKSQGTIEMRQPSLTTTNRPAPMNLSSPMLKNSELASNPEDMSSPESIRKRNVPVMIVDEKNQLIRGSGLPVTQEDIAKKKEELQLMLEKEIERLRGLRTVERRSCRNLCRHSASQLESHGVKRAPEEQLKFLEDTMKDHFKYSQDINGTRPILSSRQLVQSQLQQKTLQNKVLETLKSQNKQEKYKEFVNAQQVASAMMDIVASANSTDVADLKTKKNFKGARFAPESSTKDLLLGGADLVKLTETEDVRQSLPRGDTLDYSPKTLCEPVTHKLTNRSKSISFKDNTSPLKTLNKEKERIVQIKVKDGCKHSSTSHHAASSQGASSKVLKVPTRLDLHEQENVSVNIASINKKIAESRRLMS